MPIRIICKAIDLRFEQFASQADQNVLEGVSFDEMKLKFQFSFCLGS
jgi:hypothetical protein